MADFLFAAWFGWMTPLLTALSSLRAASRMSGPAVAASPAAAASRNLRTAVLSEDFTALLRCLACSFCLLRLIWDLMFATDASGPELCGGLRATNDRGRARRPRLPAAGAALQTGEPASPAIRPVSAGTGGKSMPQPPPRAARGMPLPPADRRQAGRWLGSAAGFEQTGHPEHDQGDQPRIDAAGERVTRDDLVKLGDQVRAVERDVQQQEHDVHPGRTDRGPGPIDQYGTGSLGEQHIIRADIEVDQRLAPAGLGGVF